MTEIKYKDKDPVTEESIASHFGPFLLRWSRSVPFAVGILIQGCNDPCEALHRLSVEETRAFDRGNIQWFDTLVSARAKLVVMWRAWGIPQ